MRVPRHWIRETADVTDSRGRTHRGEGWGWSETAVEEARQRAKAVAEKVAAWLARGDLRFHRDDAGAPPASASIFTISTVRRGKRSSRNCTTPPAMRRRSLREAFTGP